MLGLSDAGGPGCEWSRCARVREKVLEGPGGLLVAAATDGAHEGLQCAAFLWAGDVPRGEEPVKFMLGEWGCKPAEKKLGAASERNLGEGDAEGEREGRVCVSKERALDLAAAERGVLCDDEKAGLGMGGELTAARERAGDQLRLGVWGFMEVIGCRRFVKREFAPPHPRVKEFALDGLEAVKTG